MSAAPHRHALTVLGHDRPGIIAETTGRLAELGLNLEDSTMTLLRGHFAMMLVCAGRHRPGDRVGAGAVDRRRLALGLGVSAQVFCVDVQEHPKAKEHHGTFVLCNAEVVDASRNEKAREGCMSVPDLTGDVKRAARVSVRGELPGTGEGLLVPAVAFEARALQHEVDHCQGLLLLDRAAGAHAIYPRRTYL